MPVMAAGDGSTYRPDRLACTKKEERMEAHLGLIKNGWRGVPVHILRQILESKECFSSLPEKVRVPLRGSVFATPTLVALPKFGDAFGGALTMIEKMSRCQVTLVIDRGLWSEREKAIVIHLTEGNFEYTLKSGTQTKITISINGWKAEHVVPVIPQQHTDGSKRLFQLGGGGGILQISENGDTVTLACMGIMEGNGHSGAGSHPPIYSLFDQGNAAAALLFEEK